MKKNKINRRDSLKVIGLASLTATTSLVPGCKPAGEEQTTEDHAHHHDTASQQKGFKDLSEADQQLLKEKFFTEHEFKTVEVLSELIIPADERSGGASEAKAADFIEFMMKDQPVHQTKMRGGLKWIDYQCQKRFTKNFIDTSSEQQKEILDEIAYPEQAKPEMSQGVSWFNTLRDFVATGFFTSEIGIKDLEYMGNAANVWQGSPQKVLDKLGVSYDDDIEYA
ncbi:MAG: gluconate 2-dehydrogenase subunit 3 family protein [Bacteroidota bacterium]